MLLLIDLPELFTDEPVDSTPVPTGAGRPVYRGARRRSGSLTSDPRFAGNSNRVMKGIYIMNFRQAKFLVVTGQEIRTRRGRETTSETIGSLAGYVWKLMRSR